MTKTERELAEMAAKLQIVLVHVPRMPYFVRTWEGTTLGPMNARECRVWLAACSVGMAMHAPDCQCGRVSCNHRNAVMRGERP